MRNLKWMVLVVVFSACQAQEPDLNSSIVKMETEIKAHAEMDTAIAKDLTVAYEEYAMANPQDSLAPIYLSRAADIYKEMDGKALKSVNLYNKIASFPTIKKSIKKEPTISNPVNLEKSCPLVERRQR